MQSPKKVKFQEINPLGRGYLYKPPGSYDVVICDKLEDGEIIGPLHPRLNKSEIIETMAFFTIRNMISDLKESMFSEINQLEEKYSCEFQILKLRMKKLRREINN